MAPIRLALLGSGVFARDAHVPAILTLGDVFEVAAIYSRRAENAKALAAQLPYPAAIYTDVDELLKKADVEAVDIILPRLINSLNKLVKGWK